MLTIRYVSTILLITVGVAAKAPCPKDAQDKAANRLDKFHKFQQSHRRPHWVKFGWNYTHQASTPTTRPVELVVTKPALTVLPTRSPVFASPENDGGDAVSALPTIHRPTTKAVIKATTKARPTTKSRATSRSTKRSSAQATSRKPTQVVTRPVTTSRIPAPTKSAGAPVNPPSSGTNAGQQALLDFHNTERAAHGAQALVWDKDLQAAAQKWTERCVWEHGGGKSTGSGENLAGGTDLLGAAKMWQSEKPLYKGQGFSMETGHWTQMVWKSTQRIGCGISTCEGMYSPFVSCVYNPSGNYEGQYEKNVQI